MDVTEKFESVSKVILLIEKWVINNNSGSWACHMTVIKRWRSSQKQLPAAILHVLTIVNMFGDIAVKKFLGSMYSKRARVKKFFLMSAKFCKSNVSYGDYSIIHKIFCVSSVT